MLVPFTATDPNGTLDGDTVTGWLPVPLRLTVWGLPAALSFIVSVPIREPPMVGVKLSEIEQLLAGAKLVPQLFACLKSPLVVTLAILREAFPSLLNLTDWLALVVPTA
jgi:hypothetical protein